MQQGGVGGVRNGWHAAGWCGPNAGPAWYAKPAIPAPSLSLAGIHASDPQVPASCPGSCSSPPAIGWNNRF